jgi:hypothetical protein
MECISGSGPDSNILFYSNAAPTFLIYLKLPEVICPNCSSELCELSFILPSIREAEASKDYYLIYFFTFHSKFFLCSILLMGKGEFRCPSNQN